MRYIQLSQIKSHTVVVCPSFHYSSYKLPRLLKSNSTTKLGSFPTVVSALQRHNQQDTTVVERLVVTSTMRLFSRDDPSPSVWTWTVADCLPRRSPAARPSRSSGTGSDYLQYTQLVSLSTLASPKHNPLAEANNARSEKIASIALQLY